MQRVLQLYGAQGQLIEAVPRKSFQEKNSSYRRGWKGEEAWIACGKVKSIEDGRPTIRI